MAIVIGFFFLMALSFNGALPGSC